MLQEVKLKKLLLKEIFDHFIVSDYVMEGITLAFQEANTFISKRKFEMLKGEFILIACQNEVLDTHSNVANVARSVEWRWRGY